MPVFDQVGKSQEFLFSPLDSASDIAQYVFDHWPEGKVCDFEIKQILKFHFLFFLEWKDFAVEKPEILRLIFQGRFLHGNVTLGSKFSFSLFLY